jgi:hypothetical protein
MVLRRLIAWFRQSRLSQPQKAPEAPSDGGAFDQNEFGRLLNSGKTEDLQKSRAPSAAGKTFGFEP